MVRCHSLANGGFEVMGRRRSRESLVRRGPRREPFERVLIVCEGEKTEPNYLRELIAHYQLSSANVEIVGDGGAAPISVVEQALALFRKDLDYNAVFCVFDRDGHESYGRALQCMQAASPLERRLGRRKSGAARFEAITSNPCFEYWILLHYQYTTAPMLRFSDVEPRLRLIPAHAAYEKGAKGLFACTQDKLETAVTHADRANAHASEHDTDNPTTQMSSLIRYLRELAEKKSV